MEQRRLILNILFLEMNQENTEEEKKSIKEKINQINHMLKKMIPLYQPTQKTDKSSPLPPSSNPTIGPGPPTHSVQSGAVYRVVPSGQSISFKSEPSGQFVKVEPKREPE